LREIIYANIPYAIGDLMSLDAQVALSSEELQTINAYWRVAGRHPTVEFAVKMKQFEASQELSALLARGAVDASDRSRSPPPRVMRVRRFENTF
jgi:hypothetical protein